MSAEEKALEEKVEKTLEFFGAVDRNKHGNVGSTYPAWYFDNNIDTMRESIASKERSIERGEIPHEHVYYAKEEIAKEEKHLAEIVNSKPKIEGKMKDAMRDNYKNLALEIRDSMFSRDEMMKGLADPHQEAERMSEPVIPTKIDPEFARKLGIRVVNGKASRDDLSKAYKIMGRHLGENVNVEALRRDK